MDIPQANICDRLICEYCVWWTRDDRLVNENDGFCEFERGQLVLTAHNAICGRYVGAD